MTPTQGLFLRTKLVQSILVVLSLIYSIHLNAQTIYVAPTGNDANSGSSADPVKTFQKGADLAKNQGSNTVEFADGEYVFTQTVVLDASYSGIAFKAASGATPIFTSLVKVNGWSAYNGTIMEANLPIGINHVRYLQDKSENWMERSMLPYFSTSELAGGVDGNCVECNWNTPSLQATMLNVQYPQGFNAPDWSNATQYDLRHSTLMWHQEVLPVESVNTSQRRIFTTIPSLYQMRADGEEVAPRTYVVNTLEGITSPGDWASLDGKIYLYPQSGTNDIYVPTLTELIRVDAGGNGNTWTGAAVQNISFDGITFTGTEFRVMELNDITAQHDWAVVDQPDAMLRIRNAENITIQNCNFTKSGGTGIRVDRHGQNILMTNNTLTYLGRNGIVLAGRGPGYGDVNKNNEISYNYIERTGMEKWAAIAVVIDQSSNNHIHHNYITNTYFTALTLSAPRQIAFASYGEGSTGYIGREFHYYEFSPSVISGLSGALSSWDNGMQHIYNYNNLVEKNAFIDVGEGKGHFINGKAAYISGTKLNEKNSFNYNYIYDSFNHSSNDYAWYNDNDQMAAENIGNMINGVQAGGNDPEPAPLIICFAGWAETETAPTGTVLLKANVSINSTHCNDSECGHTLGNFIEYGEINNGNGGTANCIYNYAQSYVTICPGEIAGYSLPGYQQMKTLLGSKIQSFGGTVPSNCILNIAPIPLDDKIEVYPNPSSSTFSVIRKLSTPTNYTVYNFSGQIILQNEINSNYLTLDLTLVSNGLYLLRIDNQTVKLIKN